jgi:hypothetical protein
MCGASSSSCKKKTGLNQLPCIKEVKIKEEVLLENSCRDTCINNDLATENILVIQ